MLLALHHFKAQQSSGVAAWPVQELRSSSMRQSAIDKPESSQAEKGNINGAGSHATAAAGGILLYR